MSTADTKYTGSSIWKECFGDDDGKAGNADTILRKIRRQVQKVCAFLNQSNNELDPGQFPLIAGLVTELNEPGGTVDEKIRLARMLQQNV